MKKITALVLTLILVFVFSACAGNQSKENSDTQVTQPSAENSAAENSETENAAFENSKILIAYFSYGENTELPSDVDASSSASIQLLDGKITGNTGLIANYIAEDTGGDLFSILTAEKYPSNYDDTVALGQEEKNSNIKPEISTHIENFDEYDTIFVGYPNWWYGLPMVMQSFFDEYDFSGKTIIPFCTSGGSAFSDSINEIKELEPNANVVEDGLHIGASSVNDAREQVQDWINGLNP